MRIFLTGASGFVGRWLKEELDAAGHDVRPREGEGRLDVEDAEAISTAIAEARPQGVAHLAAVSAAREAADDPRRAFAVAIRGTLNVLEAARQLGSGIAVLVVSSSEVYGAPRPEDLPLTENAPLRPSSPYGLSKVAQESVALAYFARYGLPLAAARSFNHTGPGQRPDFVVPALAQRVDAVRRGQSTDIPVGNLDVRRDFSDVRDVVRAYRLILERLADGSIRPAGVVFNVASGSSMSIRRVLEILCAEAGIDPHVRVDPDLLRDGDPEEIRGDASLLRNATGWTPQHSLDETLRAVWRSTIGEFGQNSPAVVHDPRA